MNTPVKITASPLPFSDLQKRYEMPVGMNLKNMIHACNLSVPDYSTLYIFVNDEPVEITRWEEVFPKENDIISINVSLSGGEGKNPLRVVAMIAVLALATYVGGTAAVAGLGAFGKAAVVTGVGVVGALAVNALIPPTVEDPGFDQWNYGGSPSRTIGGIRNQANLHMPVQRILGTHKIYPPYAAEPYTEWVGNNLYGIYVFSIGQGEYEITEEKIGDTDIAQFEDYTILRGDKDAIADLYPNQVSNDTFQTELTEESDWQVRTSDVNASELYVELSFPQGLWFMYNNGAINPNVVKIEIQYSEAGTGEWQNTSQFVQPDDPIVFTLAYPLQSNTIWLITEKQEYFTWGLKITGLTAGTYDVRVRVVSIWTISQVPAYQQGDIAAAGEQVVWSLLRTISFDDYINLSNVYLVAMRIRLTEQINQAVNTFNCVAAAKYSTYDGSSWDDVNKIVSNSPAWAYAEVLRGASNKRPIADSKIDGDALLAWHQFCEAKGFAFNRIIDFRTTVWDLCNNITSIGRASRAIVDNKYSVILDLQQQVPVQHFSPRNSRNFKASKIFNEIPHALKCKFLNEESNYLQDEIIVYRDGYDSDNATLYETIEFWGATSPDHIWKLARYHIAVSIQRPEVFEIDTDFESIVCKRGDKVRLTHDVVLIGLGQARIKAINGNDVDIDDSITMEGGKTYGAQIRKADGTMLDTTITLDAGEQTTITLGSVAGAAIGDMIFYGETDSESMECVVLGIEPGPELSARLRLTNYAEAILAYDGGEVPAYDPVITIPEVRHKIPPVVSIDGVRTARGYLSEVDVARERIFAYVTFSVEINTEADPIAFQGEARYYNTYDADQIKTTWQPVPNIDESKRTFRFEVYNNAVYDFRIRSIAGNGQVSAWTTHSSYEVEYSAVLPEIITGLQLVQGGSAWSGLDCNIQWALPTDLWNLTKIQISIYKKTPFTLLRTVFVDRDQIKYSYSFAENEEDNNGTPTPNLIFRLWGVNLKGISKDYASIPANHVLPTDISGLTSYSIMNGALFVWNDNTDPSFAYYRYREAVNEAMNGQAFKQILTTTYQRMLTPTEKAYTGDHQQNVYFEVKAINKFGQESSAASAYATAGLLTILTRDNYPAGLDNATHVDNLVNENVPNSDQAIYGGDPNIHHQQLNVMDDVTEDTWESVGGTGSGADNTWISLDYVPADADWIEVKVTVFAYASSGTANALRECRVYARNESGVHAEWISNEIARTMAANTSAGNSWSGNTNTVKIPVKLLSNNKVGFELFWSSDFDSTTNIWMVLTGYGVNGP